MTALPDPSDEDCAAAKQELAIGELYAAGVPWRDIATRLGLPRMTVRHTLVRMGFDIPSLESVRATNRLVIAERRRKVSDMRAQGMYLSDIAEALGISIPTVQNDLKRGA